MTDVIECANNYEFERNYYQQLGNMVNESNMYLGKDLVYSNFHEWWVKAQSTVVNVVKLNKDE